MGQSRGRVAFLVILALVAISAGALTGRISSRPSTSTTGHPESSTAGGQTGLVRAHVAGMVVDPGVVDVPEGGIVADAINAAGGLKPGAMVDRINLAAPVSDGDQIVVPGPDDEGTSIESGTVEGVISLNRATPAALESLPGVGPVLAERIVAFRDSNGPFEVVEDLLEVPGIGEAKLDALRDLVRP